MRFRADSDMFNPFKKSKPGSVPAKRPAGVAAPKVARPAAPAASAAAPAAPKGRRTIGVLAGPHQTEKATAAQGQGWYTFRVGPRDTKGAIRRAVEERYGVSVTRVRILAARSRAVRLGRIRGETPGFKKAMVKVQSGQSIEFS